MLFGAGGTAVGAVLLAIVLFAAGVFSSGGKTIEGPGFATPEDAAKAYLTALRDQDLGAMISAFAVESYADHYDFEALVERLNSYNFNFDMPFPNTSDYTRQLNIESRRDRIVRQILLQYMLYNTPEAFNDGTPVAFGDPDAVSDFVEDFGRDTEDYIFEDLVITGTMSPEVLTDNYMADANQENIEKQAKTFGVEMEDVANLVISFDANGGTWLFCPQAVRYDGRWYLQASGGNIAMLLGMSSYAGGLAPVGDLG
jgi:hypothetical protein